MAGDLAKGELAGKAAIVTGSNRGIGRAIALALASEGCDILLTGRDAAALAETGRVITDTGVRVSIQEGDLADPAVPAALAEQAKRDFGRLDIVVANAGATRQGAVTELSDADWEMGLGAKFLGHVRLARSAWALLRESQGTWLSIAGSASRTPRAQFAMTSAVNNALIAVTKSLSDLGLADGVRVNTINPGNVDTARYWKRLRAVMEETGLDEAAARIEYARRGSPAAKPEEIAELALFILTKRGRFFHGSTIDIDGGVTPGI